MTSAAPVPSAAAQPPSASASQRGLLLALGAAVFIVNLDARVIAPLLPTMANELHVSLARAGWLVSAYMLPYGLCQLVYGPIADRFGKINVCAYAMTAFSLGTAFCAFWPSFSAILTLRALTGAAAAGLIPLTLAYIGDTVPYEERQAAIAALLASAGAAQAFSTSAGGSIAAIFSWRSVFPCLGVLAGVATLGLFALRRRAVHYAGGARPSLAAALAAPQMTTLLTLVAVEGFLYLGGFSYLSGLLDQRFRLNALQIGLVLALAGVSQLTAARLLPRLIGRVSERRLLSIGGTALGTGYLTSAVAPHWSFVALGCTLQGSGFILCHTTLQTRATEIIPAARGTALSLFAFSLFLGSGIGSLLFGAALEPLGFAGTFALAGGALWVFTRVAVHTLGHRNTQL
jgi:predicted MFS family arabinose efflux permease